FRRPAVQEPLLKVCIALDRGLAHIPGLRWAFWHCCMTLHKAPACG
ncbi:MAG: hypothetical protein JNL66_15240, partial [Alphaproteobacteria bacterium]|nr:hypothetical protein [Alphaproteobacteria bacterium]